ncbi:uncharacterized protein LOC105429991 isoform X1 [Pogonomyrmex barbatus]|uniref:Uncharacterized protein LOC105429991 isoform X1 n=1 Tax=Pogonomyrmex barbatus TaxID=144034 RepID=A0A8N1S7H8_9HYME|nr:uncharacterized protein LOC105429991 isoform X1 [Pogonomyrmex barbatus]
MNANSTFGSHGYFLGISVSNVEIRKEILFILSKTPNESDNSSSNDSSEESSMSISTEHTTSISSSSSDENVDLLYFPLMEHLTSGSKRYRINDYLESVDLWTEQEFKENLRLSRRSTLHLINKKYEFEQSEHFLKHAFGMKPISAKISLLFFMVHVKLISNTEPLRTMSDTFDDHRKIILLYVNLFELKEVLTM